MLDYVLVGNIENCRLEAEVSNDRGEVIAVIYEDPFGWRVEEIETSPGKIPSEFVEHVKAKMQRYVNRIGSNPPEECTRGELALWLMAKDDGTAMGISYSV